MKLALRTLAFFFWLALLCGCTTFWEQLDEDMAEAIVIGGFAGQMTHSNLLRHQITQVPRQSALSLDSKSIGLGKAVYQEHCMRCHGAQASGNGTWALERGVQPANLLSLAEQLNKNKFVFEIKKGNSEMPDWNEILTDAQIDTVASYIVHLSHQKEVTK